MKRKIRTILLIILCWVFASAVAILADLSLDLMCHLEGYVGYCSSVRLPNIFYIIELEILLMTLLCSIYIYSENYALSKDFLKYSVVGFTINLIFMSYKVLEYPLLIKVSSIWNSRLLSKSNLIHPLLYLSVFGVLFVGILSYRNREKMNGKFLKVIFGISLLLLLVEVVAIACIEYEHCFG